MKQLFTLVISFFLVVSLSAQDTFSICAVDTATGEVGSAGASCLDDDDIEGGVFIISDVHPGVGVVHTQSYWRPANQAYAQQLMNDGLSPQQIIDSLVANDDQNNPTIRQYGVVDLSGDTARSAAFTGENCFDYKNHILGPNYAIQGNILLGQEILDSMEYRFLHTEGELACKLMAAMQGAKVVGADTRCAPVGVSSLSAFVRVAQPGDSADALYLDLLVPKVLEGVDPIDSLQTLVDQWGGCTTTSLRETTKEILLNVYPNPASGRVYFEVDAALKNEKTELLVFNTRGQVVFHIADVKSTAFSWDTASFPRGIYFYRMQKDGNTVANGKLVLE